jgi:hypothetical protein
VPGSDGPRLTRSLWRGDGYPALRLFPVRESPHYQQDPDGTSIAETKMYPVSDASEAPMTPFNHTSRLLTGAGLCAALLLPISAGGEQAGCASESFTGAAVIRFDADAGAGLRIDISVASWTAEREKDRLVRVLAEQGAATFANALRDVGMPLGEIRAVGRLPSPLRFAWQERLDDGGRRLLLITDRTLAYWTDFVRPAGAPDAFTLIEIRIPLGCEGEGKVGSASDVRVNRSHGLMELTAYDAAPVRLTNVITRCTP